MQSYVGYYVSLGLWTRSENGEQSLENV